jgi:hypothetical protein
MDKEVGMRLAAWRETRRCGRRRTGTNGEAAGPLWKPVDPDAAAVDHFDLEAESLEERHPDQGTAAGFQHGEGKPATSEMMPWVIP